MSKAGLIGIAILALVIGAVIGYMASPAKTVTQTVMATQTATLTQTATVTQSAPPPAAQPLLIPVPSATVAVNATAGATVGDGPIIVAIRPGTYAMVDDTTLSAYNFSIVLYRVVGVGPAPDGGVPALIAIDIDILLPTLFNSSLYKLFMRGVLYLDESGQGGRAHCNCLVIAGIPVEVVGSYLYGGIELVDPLKRRYGIWRELKWRAPKRMGVGEEAYRAIVERYPTTYARAHMGEEEVEKA